MIKKINVVIEKSNIKELAVPEMIPLLTTMVFVASGQQWMLDNHWFVAISSILCIYICDTKAKNFRSERHTKDNLEIHFAKAFLTGVAIVMLSSGCPSSVQVLTIVLAVLSLISQCIYIFLCRNPDIALNAYKL